VRAVGTLSGYVFLPGVAGESELLTAVDPAGRAGPGGEPLLTAALEWRLWPHRVPPDLPGSTASKRLPSPFISVRIPGGGASPRLLSRPVDDAILYRRPGNGSACSAPPRIVPVTRA